MKLYLIRHQKTLWNIEGRLQGIDDTQSIIIDDEFITSIDKNKKLLNEVNFDLVCSSPQKRAWQTADAYGFKDYYLDQDVVEYNFGIWEGRIRNDMLEAKGNVWLSQFTEFDDGEPYKDFSARLDNMLDKHQHLDNVLIFTHGTVCRYLISKVNNTNPNLMNQVHVANNKVIVLEA